jgi:hypothetical protein
MIVVLPLEFLTRSPGSYAGRGIDAEGAAGYDACGDSGKE